MLDDHSKEAALRDEDTAAPETWDAPEADTGSTAQALGRAAGVAALASATAACGGGSSGGGGSGPIAGGGGNSGGATPTPTPTVVKPQTDQEAARFLLRASLSASTGDIASLRDRGYEPWLNARMEAPNNQTGAQFLQSRGFETVDTNNWYDQSRPGDHMIWSQLFSGGNSVRKRAALAMSEFFVVSLNSLNMTWRSSAITAYWDILNQRAFGNFRDLLEDITLNPAMGVYLNTRGNRKADPSSGRVPDENFGREIMQLFTIGLYELNIDGSLRLDGSSQPIETYDNDDVTGIAKAFTGYDFDFSGIGFTQQIGGTRQIPDAQYARQPMTADTNRWRQTWLAGRDYHSAEEKSFLGVTIPAGTSATETLRITLDTLFNHANVGPFFGKQMIQRLVTSNPSPAYVRRVAEAFNDNGSGVRGDLRAVFKAILLDDEALDTGNLSSAQFGKVREPMLRFVQWGRTFGARSVSGNWQLRDMGDAASGLGQSPLRSPSVFNFFRPGYVPQVSETASAGLVAPEMQITNETSVAGYVNFMERAIEGEWWKTRDVKADYADQLPIAHDTAALVDQLDLLLTAGQLSDTARSTITAALDASPVGQGDSDDAKRARIYAAVFMVMISNDYTVQR
ncbi:DUF1800 domain-containing protein [Aurantiacibacter sediminis]|uniref:DUF1800 family protein n=1 Tax=Aurantiacibacter sediminis TaxID=2793064 RepID=A0ABS0N273_9SPHN|nr:DUF1800 family protein [Aurantiacibacter sediminis]MBH5322054.1 DUF1800 family protein [Aurantiacibacter sediminis]